MKIRLETTPAQEFEILPQTAHIIQEAIKLMAEVEPIKDGRVTFHLRGRRIIPEVAQTYRTNKRDH
jgi:hypothetical protein